MDKHTKASDESKSVHSGHRERTRTRFLVSAGHGFADHEILECLLFFSIPRVNTNEIAHRLLDVFGSLEGVFSADYEKLIAVKGCKQSTAFLIKLVGHIIMRINFSPYRDKKNFKSIVEVGEFLIAYFKGLSEEHFAVMLFDSAMNLLEFCDMSKGGANGASADPVNVARLALNQNASVVIIAHNHLSGNTIPGSADKELTNKINASLSAIGVHLLDHVIVSGNAYSTTLHHRQGRASSLWINNDIDENILKSFYSNQH